MLRILMFF